LATSPAHFAQACPLIAVIRDRDAMGIGDSMKPFWARLARSRRIFVVPSDKQLRSSFCMYEPPGIECRRSAEV
jgi:hypothetical protein